MTTKKSPTTATSTRDSAPHPIMSQPALHPIARLGCTLLAAVLLSALAVAAQPVAKRTVRGQVLDEKDKAVAGALVSLTNLSSKERTTVVTDKEGRYQFNEVSRKFDFELTAEFEGRKARPRRLSQFDPRDITVFNFKLEPRGENAEKKDNP